jgi:hypothetical protein
MKTLAQTTWTTAQLAERTLERGAVEAAIRGMPLVNRNTYRLRPPPTVPTSQASPRRR